ncbi:MAG TPA: glycosyltransferase [Gemmatimonadales bacterium]|nr:glycosyltransferase [Gemmatimonadales bacterium]
MTALAVGSSLLLGIVWIGYPFLMRAVAALTPRRPAVEPQVWPEVTVVIASRDTAEAILARVDDVLAGDYPGELNVVVALDTTSSTSEAGLVGQRPSLRIVRGDPPGGKAATLNAGVRTASGEILVFTDTHQRFAADAIRALVVDLSDGTYAATSGRLELPAREEASLIDRYWRMERRLRRDEARVHSAIGVSGSIYAMRRAEWEALPAGLILDDLYVPMRLVLARRRVGFTDAARASDIRRTVPSEEYRRKVRTLTGNFQLCAWQPAVLLPVRNPVWLQFLLHKLLRLLTPYLLVCLGGALLAILVARFGVYVFVTGAGVLLLLGLAAAAVGKWRALTNLAAWGISLQAAIVTATYYGLRGRWDVWRR